MGFVLFIAFAYVDSLWSQKYLKKVQDHWSVGPITDIQFIQAIGQNSQQQCPEGYEIATSGNFDGYLAGCDCTNSKKAMYSGIRVGYCDKNETMVGCKIVERQDPISYNIYDGKIICIQRDQELNFYNIGRPSLKQEFNSSTNISTTIVQCKQDQQLCGSEEKNHEFQTCISNTKKCPITNLNFTLVNQTNETQGVNVPVQEASNPHLPLIALKMSEYGAPCIEETQENTTPNRKEYTLIRKSTFEGCTKQIQDKFNQPGFRLVEGYQGLTEKKIFEDNQEIQKSLNKLPKYDMNAHSNYIYNLYQMSYPFWTHQCYSTEDNFPVTPNDVNTIISNAKQINDYAIALLSISCVMTVFFLVSVFTNFCTSKKYMSTQKNRNINFFRQIGSFLLTLICLVLMFQMITNSDRSTASYLSKNQCSDDELLNNSFVTMNDYLESLNTKHIITLSILITLFAIDILMVLVNKWRSYQLNRAKKMKKMSEALLKKHKINN
eukprot:403351416